MTCADITTLFARDPFFAVRSSPFARDSVLVAPGICCLCDQKQIPGRAKALLITTILEVGSGFWRKGLLAMTSLVVRHGLWRKAKSEERVSGEQRLLYACAGVKVLVFGMQPLISMATMRPP